MKSTKNILLLTVLLATVFATSCQRGGGMKATVELHRGGAEPNDDLSMLCLLVG